MSELLAEESAARWPQIAEFRRALFDRLKTLANELEELEGRHLGAISEPSGALGSAGDDSSSETDTQRLLRQIIPFPAWARQEIDHRISRASRPEVAGRTLRTIAEDIVSATKNVEQWFTSPHASDIPTALDEALSQGIVDLEMGEEQAGIITGGEPDQLDIWVEDARRDIFGRFSAELTEPDDNGERPEPPAPIAVFRTPAHEASAPRFWPVVLGHELAHLKFLREQREATDGAEPADDEQSALEGPADVPIEDQPFWLGRLRLWEHIDLDKWRGIIDAEKNKHRRADPPPGMDDGGTPSSDAAVSPIVQRLEIADRWIEEVLCDLAMVRMFGPAAISAMANFLTAVGKYPTLVGTHPPGYLRTRFMLGYLGEVPAGFDEMLKPWRADTESERPTLPPWAQEIVDLIADHQDAFYDYLESMPGERYDVNVSERRAAITLALRQLRFGVPPFSAQPESFGCDNDASTSTNPEVSPPPHDDGHAPSAAARHPQNVPATAPGACILTDADVINAGWLAVTEQSNPPQRLHRAVPIDKLLLKSIETLQLQRSHPILVCSQTDPATTSSPAAHAAASGAILGPTEIERRLAHPTHWRRIIMTPRIDQQPVTASSVDLRLSNRFIVFQRTGISTFNARQRHNPRAVQRFIERPFDSPFVLHPSEVVLASALEYVALPRDIGAQVITRSSYGRLGLITATAVQVHPLYRGCLTLELVNLGTVPLTLYPGERVAQLVFFNVQVKDPETEPPADDLFQGRYVCPTAPEFPTVQIDEWMNRQD